MSLWTKVSNDCGKWHFFFSLPARRKDVQMKSLTLWTNFSTSFRLASILSRHHRHQKNFFVEKKFCFPKQICFYREEPVNIFSRKDMRSEETQKKNFPFQKYLPHFFVQPTSGPGVFRFRPWMFLTSCQRGQPVHTSKKTGVNRSVLLSRLGPAGPHFPSPDVLGGL